MSSGEVVFAVGPGGFLVVEGAGFEASVLDADEPGPSRGGPAVRSRPRAAALAVSRARLASCWSRVMYPGWAPGMKEIHSWRGTVMLLPRFLPGSSCSRCRP